jgi:hypothetical protein
MDEFEVLSKEELMKLNKDVIVDYHFRSAVIAKSITELTASVKILTDRLERTESELAIVKQTNKTLVEHIDRLEKRQEGTERSSTKNAQYLRNKQLQINNNGGLRNGPELKGKVAAMISKTGAAVSAADIGKCHLLGTRGNPVICELKDRDLRDDILRMRKYLKDVEDGEFGKIYINETLCDEYQRLDFCCRALKKANKIHSTWFFNGRLWIQLDVDSLKKQITHINDLYDIFNKKVIDALLVK